MLPDFLDRSIFDLIDARARELEDLIDSDLAFYHGQIHPVFFRAFRDFIEEARKKSERAERRISVVLRTGGGAREIAKELSDHKKWRSHGRNLDVEKLKALRIEIDDYSDNQKLRDAIRGYNDPLTGYIDRNGLNFYLHNANVPN